MVIFLHLPAGLMVIVTHASLVPVAIDNHRILVIDPPYDDTESFVRVFDTRTREWSNEEWPSLNQPRIRFSLCNLQWQSLRDWRNEH